MKNVYGRVVIACSSMIIGMFIFVTGTGETCAIACLQNSLGTQISLIVLKTGKPFFRKLFQFPYPEPDIISVLISIEVPSDF